MWIHAVDSLKLFYAIVLLQAVCVCDCASLDELKGDPYAEEPSKSQPAQPSVIQGQGKNVSGSQGDREQEEGMEKGPKSVEIKGGKTGTNSSEPVQPSSPVAKSPPEQSKPAPPRILCDLCAQGRGGRTSSAEGVGRRVTVEPTPETIVGSSRVKEKLQGQSTSGPKIHTPGQPKPTAMQLRSVMEPFHKKGVASTSRPVGVGGNGLGPPGQGGKVGEEVEPVGGPGTKNEPGQESKPNSNNPGKANSTSGSGSGGPSSKTTPTQSPGKTKYPKQESEAILPPPEKDRPKIVPTKISKIPKATKMVPKVSRTSPRKVEVSTPAPVPPGSSVGKTKPKQPDVISIPENKDKEIHVPSKSKDEKDNMASVDRDQEVVAPPVTEPRRPPEIITPPPINVGMPPPRTTAVVPRLHIIVRVKMSMREFCAKLQTFKEMIARVMLNSKKGIEIVPSQVIILYQKRHCERWKKRFKRMIEATVKFYILDREGGHYSLNLTNECFNALKERRDLLQKGFDDKILDFRMSGSGQSFSPHQSKGKGLGTGIIVAIVLLATAGFCLLVLLQVIIFRRRRKGKKMRPYVEAYGGNTTARALDSIALSGMALPTTQSTLAGFLNPGLDVNVTSVEPQRQFSQCQPSNAICFKGFAMFNLDMEALETEFRQLPNNMPRLSEVPSGAEHKNRYANVIPIPVTRVYLKPKTDVKASEYINANFVQGYRGKPHSYIATQAPIKHTVQDFWQMVWEQQTKVIVMATGLEENGISKCEEYFPRCDGVDNTLTYGDFMVVLKLQDVRQDYILSALTLKDMERNLCREVVHFWYTGWPSHGVPESPVSMIHFLLHVQAYQAKSKHPAVIHCSPGTGRTGTMIAVDICMKAFEENGICDILNTVYRVRQDRAGAVQTKEQYAFIYQAINEYALMISEPSMCPEEKGLPSRSSKVGTPDDEMLKKY